MNIMKISTSNMQENKPLTSNFKGSFVNELPRNYKDEFKGFAVRCDSLGLFGSLITLIKRDIKILIKNYTPESDVYKLQYSSNVEPTISLQFIPGIKSIEKGLKIENVIQIKKSDITGKGVTITNKIHQTKLAVVKHFTSRFNNDLHDQFNGLITGTEILKMIEESK